jgi:signal transduction histidine kinase
MFEMRMAKLNSNSVIAISRDITSRKTIQFNLSKALKKAEESDRLKSAFLSNLSHEIRTPLNIITNFTRMLTEPMIEEEEKFSLSDSISQNSQQLMKMIDNTIHLSKIETDNVHVANGFCPINNLLRNIYNHYMPIIPDSKNVRLQLMVDVQNKEFGFETDGNLLKESMEIFVDNALKYTENGTVKFGYEMIMNEAVKFFVSDTGIGIPEEEKEHIFSRFYRVKNEINRTTSGSGIGLPIAQHYIQLIGGELQLESSPNKGTTLSFILPFNNGKGYMKLV